MRYHGQHRSPALILAMVDEIVMDMVPVALDQKNRSVTEAGNLAVVDLQSGMIHLDSPREGKLVVVFATASLGKGTAVMVHIPFRVRPADSQTGNPHVRPHGPNEPRRLERVGVNQCAFGVLVSTVACQGHAAGYLEDQLLDVHPCGAVDLEFSGDEDDLACLGFAKRVE